MRASCLSVHAQYRCHHAGACCTAGWPIPIEPEKAHVLRANGLLRRIAAPPPGGRAQVTLPKGSDGACALYSGHESRLCTIQRDLGETVMPTACRNFPRVALRDPRGLFVSLSHVCPTAARLLLSTGPLAVVVAPRSITLDLQVDALDATTVLPPALRADMLMDWEGYTAWEREAIAVLDDDEYGPRGALAIISAAATDAAGWSPGRGALAGWIADSFDRARFKHGRCRVARDTFDRPVKAFLAAHLFASWLPYTRHLPQRQDDSSDRPRSRSGQALASIAARLEQALTLAGERHPSEESFIAAVGRADLRLRHGVDDDTREACSLTGADQAIAPATLRPAAI